LIGICGLPGVGKTTMAKEVAKQAKENGLFVEVAWASVGQKPNHVQACIADMLGLTVIHDRASPKVRADLLRERLLQDDKKILVILDDIWEEIDLEDMGIPLGGANKNFKMLYTSQSVWLWVNLFCRHHNSNQYLCHSHFHQVHFHYWVVCKRSLK